MLRADLHRQLRNRWNLGHRWRRLHLQSHVVAGFVGVVGVVGFFAADVDVGVGGFRRNSINRRLLCFPSFYGINEICFEFGSVWFLPPKVLLRFNS